MSSRYAVTAVCCLLTSAPLVHARAQLVGTYNGTQANGETVEFHQELTQHFHFGLTRFRSK